MSDDYEIRISEAEHVCRKFSEGGEGFVRLVVQSLNLFPFAKDRMRESIEMRERIDKRIVDKREETNANNT